MNKMIKSKQSALRIQSLLVSTLLVASMGLVATAASATTINASVGGVPSGADAYENFDNVPLGSNPFTTNSGIVVTFGNDGRAASGATANVNAAPFLSGGNGANFGSQPDGADTTTYLTSGSTNANSGANVTLTFAGPTRYMGLLWGSVDDYNTLTFFNGATQVAVFTGADVGNSAGTGNCIGGVQSMLGTCYVNINLSDSFDRVVATSSQYAFEFDNVAFSASPLQVPEPGTVGVFLLGLLLVGSAYRFKGRRA